MKTLVAIAAALIVAAPAFAGFKPMSHAEKIHDAETVWCDGQSDPQACARRFVSCTDDLAQAVNEGGGPATNAIAVECSKRLGL
jgi:hypothetical protein